MFTSMEQNAMNRRTLLKGGATLMMAGPALALAARVQKGNPNFPSHFLRGASTAPHQIEGNNVASDLWFLENQQPTVFAQPSGDACNSFALWETDLDIVKKMGLNCYRFGIERATFIPEALTVLKQAIDDGVPVLGYCHWSLFDNFEWTFGYKPHFGLHSVDHVTFARTAKPSAAVYGAIARRNAV